MLKKEEIQNIKLDSQPNVPPDASYNPTEILTVPAKSKELESKNSIKNLDRIDQLIDSMAMENIGKMVASTEETRQEQANQAIPEKKSIISKISDVIRSQKSSNSQN